VDFATNLDFGPGLTGPVLSNASVYSNLPLPAAPATAQPWDDGLEGAAGKQDESPDGKICQWSMVQFVSASDDSMVVVPSYAIFPLTQV